jgi:hypothetical protein
MLYGHNNTAKRYKFIAKFSLFAAFILCLDDIRCNHAYAVVISVCLGGHTAGNDERQYCIMHTTARQIHVYDVILFLFVDENRHLLLNLGVGARAKRRNTIHPFSL